MRKIGPIYTLKQNGRSYTAVIMSTLLLSVSAIAAMATPQNMVDGEQAGELVSLNLRDVNIGVFINRVAESSGKNIIIDARVKAKVTVVSEAPLDSKQLYITFLSVLEAHNFAVVDIDQHTIKIVPNDAIMIDRLFKNREGFATQRTWSASL